MSAAGAVPPGDRARVSVVVAVGPGEAFRAFTEELDLWWRRGLRYRVGGRGGLLVLEPGVGGRLVESFDTPTGPRTVQTGTVTEWAPPGRLAFEWRAMAFAPEETTVVQVDFEPHPRGTLVTVTHRGWSAIRPDHPARHGLGVAAFLRMMGLWWADLLGGLAEHAAAAGNSTAAPRERPRE